MVTLRPFNTFGPRQSARAVIPTIITQIAAGRDEIKLGSTTPTRDFTHVTDTAKAFMAVGEAPSEQVVGEVFNAGSGSETSVAELVQLIAEEMGRSVRVVPEGERMRPNASEVMRLLSDSSKLRSATGWLPQVSLSDGLRRTIAWFTEPANIARYKVDLFNV